MELNISWLDALMVAGLGVGVVCLVLTMLVFLLKGFSFLFIEKKKPTTDVSTLTTNTLTETELAAISAALHLFYQDVHDEESYVITINHRPTLWNAKIFGLNKFSRWKKFCL